MASDFGEVMKEMLNTLAPGLKDFGPEVGAELKRLGTQGAMEMAQALFNGAAFTPYGPGQYTPTPQVDRGNEVEPPQIELERGGQEM